MREVISVVGGGGLPQGKGQYATASFSGYGSVSVWLGKGFREPCYPNRQFNFFNVPMSGLPAIPQLNCLPAIVGQTNAFDVSILATYAADYCGPLSLITLTNLSLSSPLQVNMQWIGTGNVIYSTSYSIPAGNWGWYYVWWVLNYAAIAKNGNGNYIFGLQIPSTGYSAIAGFTVSGVPVTQVGPPITDRINAAKAFIDRLYQTDGTYGYIKEYPGLPLGIYVRNTGDLRLSGDLRLEGPTQLATLTMMSTSMPVSKISNSVINPTNDAMTVAFEDSTYHPLPDYNEGILDVQRRYSPNGSIEYYVAYKSYGGTYHSDIYLGNTLLYSNVGSDLPGVINLKVGRNDITWTGPAKSTATLFAPINLLINACWLLRGGQWYAYYASDPTGSKGITKFTQVLTGDWFSIDVKQACTLAVLDAALMTVSNALPCNRYTVRHGAALGQHIYTAWGDSTKASMLAKIRAAFGFTCDIYDPLFGASKTLDDNFMFTPQAYADTIEKWRSMPRGLNPHRYPYFSKVQLARDLYIGQSYSDPLLQCLQAIHILNKYNDPNRQYILGSGATPLIMANLIYQKWNGIGIPSPMGPSTTASGVRTAAFFALATLLGFKYGITDMRTKANMIATTLTGLTAPQSGMYPLASMYTITQENGQLLRPPYQGAFYAAYTRYGSQVAAISSTSLLQTIVDYFGMPGEDPGPIPGGQEVTQVMLQALRIYARYALGIAYPSLLEMP